MGRKLPRDVLGRLKDRMSSHSKAWTLLLVPQTLWLPKPHPCGWLADRSVDDDHPPP